MRQFFTKLARSLRGDNTARAARRGPRRLALQVEALEERQLLTVSAVAQLNPIQGEYAATAGEKDAFGNNVQALLGAATSGQTSVPGVAGALMETFQHGTIYYSFNSQAHVIYGDVAVKYRALGGPAAFGLPYSDEAPVAAVPGLRVTNFLGGPIQGSHAIYWSAATGSHAVLAGIGADYTLTANEKDAYGRVVQQVLGAPTSDEQDAPGVAGARMSTFVGGTIYLSPGSTIGHVVYGGIAAKYASLGASGSTYVPYTIDGGFGSGVLNFPGFGLPISDEAAVPGVPGVRVTNFSGDRAIYWSGTYGAYAVTGLILDEYQATAGEKDASGNAVQGVLGAPTSDVKAVPGVANASMNTFKGGAIYWSNPTGAHAVYGPIAAKYASLAGPAGFLGLPTGDEDTLYGGPGRSYWGEPTSEKSNILADPFREGDFQNGKILIAPPGIWTAQGGTQVIYNVSSMTFTWPYVGSDDGTPVGGGPFQLTVWENGYYQITGHLHDSGYWSYHDEMRIDLLGPTGAIWTKIHAGHMNGTDSPGSRDDLWNQSGFSPYLAADWAHLEGGKVRLTVGVDKTYDDCKPQVDQWINDSGLGDLTNSYAGFLNGNDDDDNSRALFDTGYDVPPEEYVGLSQTRVLAAGVVGYPVTLDASALGVPSVSVDGAVYDASTPFLAELIPGEHALSTNGTDATAFTVNPDGTVSYDPALEGALTGSGTTSLAVNGYAVALDATGLGVGSVTVDGVAHDATVPFGVNLLPGQHALTTTGTDATAFTVNADGTVAYDPAIEGALTGSGSTGLAVNGYAVALDASALSVPSVSVDGVDHDAGAPLAVSLLPGQHTLSTDGVTVLSFTVNTDGTVTYDPALEGPLTGSGTTSLVFPAP